MPEVHEFIINPDGVKAFINWSDDSNTHDSGNLLYTVYVKFADPSLNPPDQDCWVAGYLDKHYTKFKPDMAFEIGRRFYDFLMSFRTLYGQESHILTWQKRYEEEKEARYQAFRERQDTLDQLRWSKARVAELETDYVKLLEAEIAIYRTALLNIREASLNAMKQPIRK